MPGGRERFAGGNLLDDGVRVDVAGKIEIKAAAAGFRPRLYLLPGRVEDGIAFDRGKLAVLEPLAIEVAFDAPAAADVGGAQLGLIRGRLRGRQSRRASGDRQKL